MTLRLRADKKVIQGLYPPRNCEVYFHLLLAMVMRKQRSRGSIK